jgi:hypothetical protein
VSRRFTHIVWFRLILSAVAGLLLLTGPVRAQELFTIVDTARLPAASFVGDPVELRYRIRTDAELESSVTPPPVPWGEIRAIQAVRQDAFWQLRILAVPYEPGTLSIPQIDLGGVTVDGLSLVVNSVLSDEDALEPVYGPQVIPGTRAMLAVGAFLLVFPVMILIVVLGPGRNLVRRFIASWKGRAPHRQLVRRLDHLEARLKQETAREFYTGLILAVQEFMTARLDVDCRAATSSELRVDLPRLAHRSGADSEATAPLVEILESADRAKFGHEAIRRRVRRSHLGQMRAVAELLEESRRRQKRQPRGKNASV